MPIQQIIHDLVEGDTAPPLTVRFTGLDLATYGKITARVTRPDGTKFERDVTPVGVSDAEAGTISWATDDLIAGTSELGFVLFSTDLSQQTGLPRRYPVLLNVRGSLA